MSETDFIESLYFTGFTARIKRLSDQLLYDARALYKELGLEIEPNWHLILLLLKDRGAMGVTEIAKNLGFSHPAVIKISKKMKERGYLVSCTDTNDSRKQLLSLSEKAIQELPDLESRWHHIQLVIQDIVPTEFMQSLSSTEEKLAEQGLLERVNERLKNEKNGEN